VSAATFAPGTRVRRADDGRTGTVDYTAVETDSLAKYPDMVPVAYDGDDAWLTAPHVLEVIDPLPATVEPKEPGKAANDGGTNERSTQMSTTVNAPGWVEERFEEGSEDEYWERVAPIGTVVGGEWTAETIKGVDGATKVAVQTQGDVHGDGSDLMASGSRSTPTSPSSTTSALTRLVTSRDCSTRRLTCSIRSRADLHSA